MESIPRGVLPFEVYSQAPLRLISWCSFELPKTAKKLRELAEMCELPETTTQALITHIAVHNSEVKTEQEATQYLASLATVTISSRTKLLNYTTMVQHFLGTLQLPMAVYMFFLWPAPLSFDWSPHLRLTCGPAGNRTTTGSLPTTPQGRLHGCLHVRLLFAHAQPQ